MNRLTRYMALLGTFLLASQAYATVMPQEESYKKDVSPILHENCLTCHKPKGMGYEKNGLDMRTYKSLMKGTKFGPVIKPGDSFTSVLIMAIQGRVHPSIKMPYGAKEGLPKDKIEVIKKWVEQGAKDN
jgi:hypothetical protein